VRALRVAIRNGMNVRAVNCVNEERRSSVKAKEKVIKKGG
jgi:hypothetical protein